MAFNASGLARDPEMDRMQESCGGGGLVVDPKTFVNRR